MPEGVREFDTKVESGPGGRVWIAVPFHPADAWGKKNRHYVTGTVNGRKVRASLGANGETFFIPLGQAWRRDNGIESGDRVTVVIWPEGPQQETLADDVAAALAAEPEARAFFDGLATFYRKGYVNWVEEAKRPETRARRIGEMVSLLKAGKKQR